MSIATKLKQQRDVTQHSTSTRTVLERECSSPALDAIEELYAEVEDDLLRARRNIGRSTVLRAVFTGLAVVFGVMAFGTAIGWFFGAIACAIAALMAHIAVLNFAMEVAGLEATLRRPVLSRGRDC